jgi:hypothetical protein
LRREPRKVYYFPSPGHLRISHYETLKDYHDRIFSKNIIDLSHIENKEDRKELPVFLNHPYLRKTFQTKLSAPEPPKPKIKSISNFIIVSDDESESGCSEAGSEAGENEETASCQSFLSEYNEEEIESVYQEEETDYYEDFAFNGGDIGGESADYD